MDLERRLADVVGPEHVLVDPDLTAGFQTDWTRRWSGPTRAVVRPASTAEIREIVQACADESVAIIPQGGNTGLVGGGVPRPGVPAERQIVLSTHRLDELGPVDRGSMQVTAGAGVTIARWRTHARAAGLDAGIDFAARDTATVGGAISTNAGGSRVLRFGTMRSQIMGIEAVLSTGDVIGSMTGLPKETAGLHWPSLLCGAEGTLGVVTRARLRLVPFFGHTATAMVSVASVEAAISLLEAVRSRVPALDAVEVMLPEALHLVAAHLGTAPPVPATGPTLLIDCADNRDPSEELLAALTDSTGIVDTALATDESRRHGLLDFRDRLTESIAAEATRLHVPVFKLDVAVPVSELDSLLSSACAAADEDGCRLIPFGHLAEGNLHLNFLGVHDAARVADSVLGHVAGLGGTISAEHGIGVAKAGRMTLIRSAGDLAAQRRLADALDPAGIMNPGVLGRREPPQVP